MVQIFDQVAETAARILLRQGTVTGVTELPGQLRQIDIATAAAPWKPGQKVQVHISGRLLRTYTPCRWTDRSVTLLVHRVGGTPGTGWVDGLAAGLSVRMVGPRPSLDLSRLPSAPIVVGDETSVGLAVAWSSQGNASAIAHIFECSSADELGTAFDRLELGGPKVLVEREGNDAHLETLLQTVADEVGRHPGAPLVLSGRSQSIGAVRRHLKAANLRPTSFVKTYWDPNRAGLD